MSYQQDEQAQTRDQATTGPEAGPAAGELGRASALLMTLEAGDHEQLAVLLRRHPDLREELIKQATLLLGSAEVGKALAVLAGASPQSAAGAAAATPAARPEAGAYSDPSRVSNLVISGEDEDGVLIVEVVRSNPEQAPEVLAQVAEQAPEQAAGAIETVQEAPTAVAAAQPEAVSTAEVAQTPSTSEAETAQKAAPESGWITRARAYHLGHGRQVAAFNEATGSVCVGPDGELDPVLVSRWQAANGVPPDGRVGPATVAAAKASNQPAAAAAPTPVAAEPTIAVGSLNVTLE